MAQYAMYAYCFFAILSLVNTVCRSLGAAVNIPSILLTIKQWVLMLAAIALWGIFRLIQPRNEKLLRRCCEVMVFYYVFSFVLSIYFKFNLIPMTQNGLITRTATILTWTKNSIGLLSVIASLIAGCHLGRKHTGSMHQLGTALILVFIVWLICSNILPVAVFYLAGNTQQAAFISMNIISMITTTSAYIYAYYRMFRAIKTK